MSDSVKISRRQFLGGTLGASMVLSVVPAGLLAAGPGSKSESEVVLRCAIMSDVHFNLNPNSVQRKRLETVMRHLNTYAKDAAHPGFDAVMVVGDMSDHGYAQELIPFRDTLLGNLPKGSQALLCMGNHEYWGGEEHVKAGGGRKNWETIFAQPANTHKIINGYHFIGVSPEKGTCAPGDYLYVLDWLREQLNLAAADDPKKPIFVYQHYHVRGTVYGGFEHEWDGVPDLRTLFEEYPQIVNFSGHSHRPANDPRSAWQGKFTAFGTATLSYFSMEGGIFDRAPKNRGTAGQVYFMEVFRDNSIYLRIFDAITETFFDTEYFVGEPGAIEKYCYTDQRYETASTPYWTRDFSPSADAPVCSEVPKITVSDVSPYCASVTFPQAHDADSPNVFHGSYQLLLEERAAGSSQEWKLHGEKNPWSEFYFKNPSKEITALLDNVDQGRDWRVTLRARNVFGKLSEEKYTAEFQTPADPDANIQDKNAPKPYADALNFFINEEGRAVNEPYGKTYPTKLETIGAPEISNGWASFDGKKDRFMVRFSRNNYARMLRGITLGVRFSFEGYGTGTNANVLGNAELGGSCFGLNNQTRKLDWWCHVAGQYHILSTPLEPGTYTVFGTYDGSELKLYVNGIEKDTRKVSGPLTYTPSDTACAYSIGSDISANYTGTNYMKGRIQFVKVFSWGLNPDQVKNLTFE